MDRVHRISIVPRGRALGYTLNLPAEDRYLKTREELLDYMTVLLGGRAAEHIVFGQVTTGASDDLKRVASIAHSMVHDFAMGNAGLGRSPDGDVRLSETTLRVRDEERQDLLEEARRAAQKLIVSHRAELDALAAELLEHEVLDREAIERIMAGVPRLERAPGVGLRVVAAAAPAPVSALSREGVPGSREGVPDAHAGGVPAGQTGALPAAQTGTPSTTYTPVPRGGDGGGDGSAAPLHPQVAPETSDDGEAPARL